jgi:2-polyprenyl-3-methyl-5-hydroxy-6-metoxy-1,4-benzoquinol methylase
VRLVAARERRLVRRYLVRVPKATVIDIPTGTGKLAEIFRDFGAKVMACDISENMLNVARKTYGQLGYGDVRFRICDAESLNHTLKERFDAAVCLRLLHRVPREVKERILRELAQVADHVILSIGVDSAYHRLRRSLRGAVLGGDTRRLGAEPLDAQMEIITRYFDVMDSAWVLPVLSQERVYLLRPRKSE